MNEDILDPLPEREGRDYKMKDRSFCFDQASIAAHICQPFTLEFDFATAWRKLQWQHVKETELMEQEHNKKIPELEKRQRKKYKIAAAALSSNSKSAKRQRT